MRSLALPSLSVDARHVLALCVGMLGSRVRGDLFHRWTPHWVHMEAAGNELAHRTVSPGEVRSKGFQLLQRLLASGSEVGHAVCALRKLVAVRCHALLVDLDEW
ncbi:unnamed protein product [Cercospora beticola]|nr:unnamed protein product [Cercospora beticola]